MARPKNIGVGVTAPTRFLASQAGAAPAVLEQHIACIYSSGFVAAAAGAIQRETELFGYVVGGNVAGPIAGVQATRFHTNMEQPRQLQAPNLFALHGIRVHVPSLDYQTAATPALDADTTGGAAARMDQVDDLTLLLHSLSLEFKIGTKTYATGPAWMFPSNVGMGGTVDTAAAGAGPGWQTRNHLFCQGRPWRFNRLSDAPPMIVASQPFSAKLSALWGGGNPSLVDAKLVFVMLDGIQGRAVQ